MGKRFLPNSLRVHHFLSYCQGRACTDKATKATASTSGLVEAVCVCVPVFNPGAAFSCDFS